MLPPDPIFHKPKDIVAAKNILYATIFLGIINWVIDHFTGLNHDRNIQKVVTAILTALMIALLTRQVGLGKKWARTVLLVLMIAGILVLAGGIFLYPSVTTQVFKGNILIAVIAIFITILQLLALKFLFSKESTEWFNKVQSTEQLADQSTVHETHAGK